MATSWSVDPIAPRGYIPIQMSRPRSCSVTPSPSKLCPHSLTTLATRSSNGSAKGTWATAPPSKNVHGLKPFVRSMTWSGTTKSRGLISSRKLPTAEKAMMVRTPIERRAATLARAGTSCGASWWCRPCRLRKATATTLPLCAHWWCRMVIGEEGLPHGVEMDKEATWVKPGSSRRPVPPMTAIRTGSTPIKSGRQPLGPGSGVQGVLTLVGVRKRSHFLGQLLRGQDPSEGPCREGREVAAEGEGSDRVAEGRREGQQHCFSWEGFPIGMPRDIVSYRVSYLRGILSSSYLIRYRSTLYIWTTR